MIVHLVEFRIQLGFEAEVVGALQYPQAAGPRPKGLLAHSVGLRLGRSHREYVLACRWQDANLMRRGVDGGSPPSLARVAHLLDGRRDTVFRVAASAGPSWEKGHLLRLYRATVPVASVAKWEGRVIRPIAGASALPGLVSILVGPVQPRTRAPEAQAVIALSAWRDWEAVLAATDGHINGPLRETDLTELEVVIGIDHYQLLSRESRG